MTHEESPEPERGRAASLSHLAEGAGGRLEARMVDVSAKPEVPREALARARVRFPAGVLAQLLATGGPKGPVTEMARAAGILAAKRTGELIPLCHPLGLDGVDIHFCPLEGEPDVLEIRCRTATTARTGVEMESLVGACVAALCVYDMTKALEKGISIEAVELLEKRGGRSGHWIRSEP